MIDIPAKYMSYLVTVAIVLIVLYVVSHYMETSNDTFGVNYVGATSV